MTFMSWEPWGSSTLYAFDGSSVSAVFDRQIRNYTIAGGWLYATAADDGVVWRTDDLASWTAVTGPLSGASGVAVHEGRVYVGTGTSRLYSHPITEQPSDPDPSPSPSPAPGTGICLLGICL